MTTEFILNAIESLENALIAEPTQRERDKIRGSLAWYKNELNERGIEKKTNNAAAIARNNELLNMNPSPERAAEIEAENEILSNTNFDHLNGQPVITRGLNGQCRPVIASGVLMFENNDWVMLTGGIRVVVYGLPGFRLDTPANRAEMKQSFAK